MEFTTIASSFLATYGSEVAKLLVDLVKKSNQAKEQYEERVKPIHTFDEMEIERISLLGKLNDTQTEAILLISNQQMISRILALLLDLFTQTYNARSLLELEAISNTHNQIKSFLKRFEIDQQARRNIRAIAVLVAFLLFIALLVFAIISSGIGVKSDYVLPILSVPLSVILWSALGSITSILYRFNLGGDDELQNPLRWLITRPLTGILMGTLVYLAVKIGFLAATSGNATTSGNVNELVWVISFLVGFSDRFSNTILRSLVGKFGGDEKGNLLETNLPLSNFNLSEVFESWTNSVKQNLKSPFTYSESTTKEDKKIPNNEQSAGADEGGKTDLSNESENREEGSVSTTLPEN